MHGWMDGWMDVCLYLCIYVSMYLCIYVPMYLCIYVSMYLCTYVSMYLCMCVCLYVCMYACMHACMYVCTYIELYHIHINTYMYHISRLRCRDTFSIFRRSAESSSYFSCRKMALASVKVKSQPEEQPMFGDVLRHLLNWDLMRTKWNWDDRNHVLIH